MKYERNNQTLSASRWFGLAAGLVVLTSGVGASHALADTLDVCPDGCKFTTIQDAVDASSSGDEIRVYPGTYTGTGDAVVTLPDHDLFLHGVYGSSSTILDAEHVRRGILGGSDAAPQTSILTIEGFVIMNGSVLGGGGDGIGDGGGIARHGGQLTLRDCVFLSNDAYDEGGAAYHADGVTIIENCLFDENFAGSKGGGVSLVRCSKSQIKNSYFTENSTSASGGAFMLHQTSVEFASCLFENGFADDGGAVFSWESHPTFVECSFAANTADTGSGADNKGGAAALYGGSARFESCSFAGNYAADDGGGVYVYQADSEFIACSFENNEAIMDGAGLRQVGGSDDEGSLKLQACTFTGNHITSTSWARGGGLQIQNLHDVSIVDCSFHDNMSAKYGGGIQAQDGSMNVVNCEFTGNIAKLGGGVYAVDCVGPDTTYDYCRFLGNTAGGTGGGVYHDGSVGVTSTFNNCEFAWNHAQGEPGYAGSGGGMRNYGATTTYVACTFRSNTASSTGGGIEHSSSEINLSSSTLCGNYPNQISPFIFDGDGDNDINEECAWQVNMMEWRVEDGGNGHWYGTMYGSDDLCWTESRALASQVNGHLATIGSDSEQAFIANATDASIWSWMGGYKDASGWHWITGEAWDYTNWHPGEPSGDGSSLVKDYGANHPLWNDQQDCNVVPGYIIEFSEDCNGDGIVDFGQIRDGSLMDTDGNWIPDVCENCDADVDDDQLVGITDLLVVIAEWGTSNALGDVNMDGIVDVNDLLLVITSWGTCP